MLLSEAIRLGAMMCPQAFGEFSEDGGRCAWGAAFASIGKSLDGEVAFPSRMPNGWGFARRNKVKCPLRVHFGVRSCNLRYSILDTIVHLNDIHRWTRERIADWVEERERELGLIPATDAREAELVEQASAMLDLLAEVKR